MVEHDADMMRAADHIVDLGPGAGELGGRIIFEGPFGALLNDGAGSLTGRYLRGETHVSPVLKRRQVNPKRVVTFRGAHAHNLKNIDVAIPLDMMVAITGVSGSGKSTLVHDVIFTPRSRAASARRWPMSGGRSALPEKQPCRRVEKAELLTEVVLVDQSPIGRTPRSNPVTYIKAFDIIRDLFASTPKPTGAATPPGHFSFNVPGGRCETCQGDGTVTVEMQFLADVELICEECKGTRYKSSVLEVRYRGLNIHEVLQLTVKEALSFFADVPRLSAKLQVLAEVGLGYLRLGQSATTLSGGEAQRVKLAAHLAEADCKNTLFIFDEPTTGLHFDDIAKLLDAFRRLIHNGASILIIEHNLEVIRAPTGSSTWAPKAATAAATSSPRARPEQIAQASGSTGQYLAKWAHGHLMEMVTPAGLVRPPTVMKSGVALLARRCSGWSR